MRGFTENQLKFGNVNKAQFALLRKLYGWLVMNNWTVLASKVWKGFLDLGEHKPKNGLILSVPTGFRDEDDICLQKFAIYKGEHVYHSFDIQLFLRIDL